jgi:hypothetical protein
MFWIRIQGQNWDFFYTYYRSTRSSRYMYKIQLQLRVQNLFKGKSFFIPVITDFFEKKMFKQKGPDPKLSEKLRIRNTRSKGKEICKRE